MIRRALRGRSEVALFCQGTTGHADDTVWRTFSKANVACTPEGLRSQFTRVSARKGTMAKRKKSGQSTCGVCGRAPRHAAVLQNARAVICKGGCACIGSSIIKVCMHMRGAPGAAAAAGSALCERSLSCRAGSFVL